MKGLDNEAPQGPKAFFPQTLPSFSPVFPASFVFCPRGRVSKSHLKPATKVGHPRFGTPQITLLSPNAPVRDTQSSSPRITAFPPPGCWRPPGGARSIFPSTPHHFKFFKISALVVSAQEAGRFARLCKPSKRAQTCLCSA